jgi:hypothetical protein
VPQATRIRPPALPRITLNTDGHRHPVENALAVFTIVAGVAAFVLGLIVRTHLPATVLGLIAFGLGAYAQLVSATREQRMLIVTGMVAAFVGLGMGIAHGGFSL